MATKTLTFPDAASREMAKTKHDFGPLNGFGEEAKKYVNEYKFASSDEIIKALKDHSGGTLLAMAFNNENNYHADMESVKEVMYHLTPVAMQQYLNEKNPNEKKKLFERYVDLLGELNTAQAKNEEIEKLIKKASGFITSTKELLGKIENPDQDILKNVDIAMKKMDEEIKAEHPNLESLKTAFASLETEAGNLVGNAEIAAAKEKVVEFCTFARKELAKDDTPAGLKDSFEQKLKKLEVLAEGKNPYVVLNEVEVLSKELHEKTSKELLMKDSSLNFMLAAMTRVTLQKSFKIQDPFYMEVIINMVNKHIKPGYESYLTGLGRLAKTSGDQSEVYSEITFHAFSLTMDELIKVNKGLKDLGITHQVPTTIPFNVVDKVFSDIQMEILDLKNNDELISDESRFNASVKLIKTIKDTLRMYLRNEADLDDSDIKILLDGPAFEQVLKGIPTKLSQTFKILSKKKEEKSVAKQQ